MLKFSSFLVARSITFDIQQAVDLRFVETDDQFAVDVDHRDAHLAAAAHEIARCGLVAC